MRYKPAVMRLFTAFASLESFRMGYSQLCLRLAARTGPLGLEHTVFLLNCLAVIAGMALAPLAIDRMRLGGVKSTRIFRSFAYIAAVAALAGCFTSGVISLALQFTASALVSGALAVCLRQMTVLLPPRRSGLFVGLSCALMAFTNAILFFQPFFIVGEEIILVVMYGFLAAALFCFDASSFEEAAKLIPVPSGADKPPNKRLIRFALLVLCLYVLLGGLLDNLYYFDAAFGRIPNFMFYILLYTLVVDIVSGFVFERLNTATIMIAAFALIFTGQALSLFAENALMVFPYVLLSNAGNTTMEIYLIALPIAYCAASRRGGVLPGLGYMLLYGGFFAVGILMPGVDQSFILGVVLLATITAIILITYLINEGKSARQSLLRKGFFAHYADKEFAAGPSIEHFANSYGLSGREAKILRHLLDGKSVSYIAVKMSLAEKSVQNTVDSILSKTGTKTISEATSLFRRMAHQALVRQEIRRAIEYR